MTEPKITLKKLLGFGYEKENNLFLSSPKKGKLTRAQQRRLNSFVREYNNLRPHEALEMRTPAREHQFSDIPFPEKIKPYVYPAHMKTMNVSKSGAMRWKAYYWVYMSSGLIGKQVAAEEIGNGVWKVFYRNVFLGYFNEKDIRDKQNITRLSTNLV